MIGLPLLLDKVTARPSDFTQLEDSAEAVVVWASASPADAAMKNTANKAVMMNFDDVGRDLVFCLEFISVLLKI